MIEYGYPKSSGSVPESESGSSSAVVSSSSGGIVFPISVDFVYIPEGGTMVAVVITLTVAPDQASMTGSIDEGPVGVSFESNGDPVLNVLPPGVSPVSSTFNYE